MPPALVALLTAAAAAGEALSSAESLDDFQRTARDVCDGFAITPEQLAKVRPAVTALDADGWAALADSGVAVVDVTRCVGAACRDRLGHLSAPARQSPPLPCP